ncbi:S9 family peptidase [bacterium]|nr:S9 family peptidase [bacterium]
MSCAPTKESVKIIPRDVLFGNPDKVSPQLSPDGSYLTYVAPYEGVLNVWIQKVGEGEAVPLTKDQGRGVRRYGWAYNGEQIIYLQDQDGDENWRIYTVGVEGGEPTLLTPDDPDVKHKFQAQILKSIPEKPDELLIGLNKRNERIHDVYHLNLKTGKMKMVEEGDPAVLGWQIDHTMTIRGYTRANPDGGQTFLIRDTGKGSYRELITWSGDDMMTSGVITFRDDNKGLFIIDSRDRNAGALIEYDLKTGKSKEIAADDMYDVSSVEMHPTDHTVQAVAFVRAKREWEVIDPAIQTDFDKIQKMNPGEFSVIDRTLDDKHWLVVYDQDNGPVKYYAYDRESGDMTFMFNHREDLVGQPLVEMKPISFQSRDGMTIHGYLSLPKDWQGPGPMVLNVHGGPWYRVSWGYDSEAQFFANRGYACLQVNFRGSTGYGKNFLNAGDREWGGTMQNDLTDAVKWAVEQGIADEDNVVIYGGSYGGYATLAGVTFTPDLYKAGVSIVGPSNLETFLNTIPPYWESFRKVMDERVGEIPRYDSGQMMGMPKKPEDFTPEEKKEIEFLHSRSPLYHVDEVKVPMLIAQGANDPRVNQAESDQFVEAMKAKGLDVEYVVYPDEGHGFARPENRLDFYAKTEKFLAKHLGGRYEE